jgi:hydroxymethylpyrimidine pyrophosphatase-like HAD family hydrolase
MSKIIFLDFDGVLAVPWTDPVELYPQVPDILKRLKDKGHILCVTSFNPTAHAELTRHGQHHHFHAFRCGSNAPWVEHYTNDLGENLSKHHQIRSMLAHELVHLEPDESICHFFDDVHDNLHCVSTQTLVATWYVDSSRGLNEDNIKHLLT